MAETNLAETPSNDIFLTDGDNPIGRQLISTLLNHGYRVTARTNSSEGAEQIRQLGGLPVFAQLDRASEIRSMLQMSKAQVVIHTASQNANHPPFITPEVTPDTLQKEAQAVIQASREAGISYLVHLSYAFLYGDTGDQVADESTQLASNDDAYIKAGKAIESMVKVGEVPYSIVRLGYLYGAESNVLKQIDKTLKAARPVNSGDGKNLASWISVEDASNLVAQVVAQRPVEAVYNGVDDQPTSLKTFVDFLLTSQGLQTSSPVASILSLFLPKKSTSLLNFSTQVSNAKAKEELGWNLKFPSYQEGLKDLLMAWRANF
jgi:nucleoside-diphosphate-sugar epimerase